VATQQNAIYLEPHLIPAPMTIFGGAIVYRYQPCLNLRIACGFDKEGAADLADPLLQRFSARHCFGHFAATQRLRRNVIYTHGYFLRRIIAPEEALD